VGSSNNQWWQQLKQELVHDKRIVAKWWLFCVHVASNGAMVYKFSRNQPVAMQQPARNK